jgi:hypothetical protein
MPSEPQESGIERSPSREHGHCRRGYAVEFNLDGVCSCRTLTVETRGEAEYFAEMLDDRDDTGRVRVVRDE